MTRVAYVRWLVATSHTRKPYTIYRKVFISLIVMMYVVVCGMCLFATVVCLWQKFGVCTLFVVEAGYTGIVSAPAVC